MARGRARAGLAALLVAGMLGACAGLNALIQPPVFDVVEGRDAELRLLGPSTSRPLGGATLRLWARVQNPNSFGLTLAALQGNVFLDGTRAAAVDFPLGLPLQAGRDTIIPLDVNISFADLPGLVDVAQRIVTQNRVAYRLDGTLTVDAAPFGQPTFGPSTWLRGESRVLR
ncbi:MAG TPA: LEA type 2 family protein [Longimicrobiales bacterium]|nr:LEA type 2 family protein [Longimicrobiales bacterium]